MRFLVKGTFYRLLYMLFAFFTGILISYLAGKNLFGQISICIVNAALLALVSGLGQDASLLWHRSAGKLNDAQAFTYGMGIIIQQLLVYAAVTFIYFSYFGNLFLSGRSVDFLCYDAMYFSGIIIWERYVTLFYASGRSIFCNKAMAWISGFSLVMIVIFSGGFINQVLDPFGMFCMLAFVQSILLSAVYHFEGKSIRIVFPARIMIRSLLGFSVIVLATNLVQFMAYRVDYWLISWFTGDDGAVGLYAQASRFAQLYWVVPNIVAAIIYHSLTAAKDDFGQDELVQTMRIMNVINLLMFPLLILFAWLNFYKVITDFRDAFKVFIILTAGMYFFCNTILLASYFSARRRLRVNLIISLSCLLIIALLDFILIPRYGISGAGWANTIAYSASGLLSVAVFKKTTGLSLTELLIIRKADLSFLKGFFLKT